MSSEEFTHWLAYQQWEPFGFEVDNFRAGSIASAVVNVVRGVAHGKKAVYTTPTKFYPPARKAKRKLTPRQQEQLRKKRGERGHSNN